MLTSLDKQAIKLLDLAEFISRPFDNPDGYAVSHQIFVNETTYIFVVFMD